MWIIRSGDMRNVPVTKAVSICMRLPLNFQGAYSWPHVLSTLTRHVGGFDLANQFAEWCFDYGTDEYPYFVYNSEKFPSEEEQISYIRAYLDQLAREGAILSTSVEDEIEVILQDIELFTMAAHLFWSLFCWKMSFRSSLDFAYAEYARTRLNVFSDIKKKYLNRAMHNGDSASDH
ncbi:Choline kinase alpha [Araneus ventricosus]|uniref:Choline kinase alpha n=1 Tax=Araneus ventricosus TaxID=182803 RepID=A0A4Y2LFP8_ARAVE|nr:Choline kinase alpha [Araneus ventricosus]